MLRAIFRIEVNFDVTLDTHSHASAKMLLTVKKQSNLLEGPADSNMGLLVAIKEKSEPAKPHNQEYVRVCWCCSIVSPHNFHRLIKRAHKLALTVMHEAKHKYPDVRQLMRLV